jgi:hypothetical protein
VGAKFSSGQFSVFTNFFSLSQIFDESTLDDVLARFQK